MTIDSGYYESLRRGVEQEYAAGMAGNTYSQTLARNRGNRNLSLMQSEFQRGVPSFTSTFAQRGFGGGVRSGVMQRAMSNYLTDYQRNYTNAQQDLTNARARQITSQRDRVIASYTLLGAVGRLDVHNLNLNTPDYLPEVHYHQVLDAWHGLRTPSGQ